MTRKPTDPGRLKARRLAGLGAIVAGLVMLTGAAVVTWQAVTPGPLYDYQLEAARTDQDTEPGATRAMPLRKGSVVDQEHGRRLAEFEVADSPGGPVLMSWTALVDDPFLKLLAPLEEVRDLAGVLQRHVKDGTQVLAWWDTSREFHHLAGVSVVFDQNLGQPLFVPAAWRPWRSNVETIEQRFWNIADDRTQHDHFQDFADALLMDEDHGIAALQALAGGQKTVLVLHARDVILLGQMAPSRLGVAFREFTDQGDVHGSVAGVQGWLGRHDYAAYTVMRAQQARLRAVALTDEASAQTLVARLLPFVGNAQHDVSGATLVYRAGGFIVYEIAAASDATATSAGTP